MNKSVYLMFGPQGSGKSTQGKILAERLNLPYFDAGSALRALAKSGSSEGEKVATLMQTGQLVPNTTLKQLFIDFMTEHNCGNGLVADGFPRNDVQIELLEELALEHGWRVTGIFIDIPDEVAKDRLANRKVLINGAWTSRDDDKPEIVAKRLETFRRETAPIIDWLKKRDELVEIDGQPPIEEVSQTITNRLRAHGLG